jgi:hypothetical protein
MPSIQKTVFFRAEQYHGRQERSKNEGHDQNEYRNNFTKLLLSSDNTIKIHLIC